MNGIFGAALNRGEKLLGAVIMLVALLSGCGGGGSGGSGGSATSTTLSGTAAQGAAMANVTITIKDKNGSIQTTPTGPDGKYSLDVTGKTPPFILRVPAGNIYVYSVATTTGSANIHPFTDLIIRNWYKVQGSDVESDFNGTGALAKIPTATEINTIEAVIRNILSTSLAKEGVPNFNLLTSSFDANQAGFDKVLDHTKVVVGTNSVSVTATDPTTGITGAIVSTSLTTNLAVADTAKPTDIAGLNAIPAGATSIVLVWNAATDNIGVAGYNIYRGTTKIATSPYPAYTDTGLASGTNYCYQIEALDGAGNVSANKSSSGCATTLAAADTTVPSAPANLAATAVSPSQINLTWGASTDDTGVAGYAIFRAGVKIASVNGTTYSDTGLPSGTAYTYSVKAIDGALNSSIASNSASATTQPGIPSSPAGAAAVGQIGQATISWNAVSGATSYNLYWSTSPGVSKTSGTKISGVTSPYVHTATNGTTYYYIVTAANISSGESIESAQTSATPQPPIPAAPTNATATAGDGQVTINWSAATGAVSYNLYWSTSSGVTKTSGTKITGVASPYTHTSRTNGAAYYYVVTAVNVTGESVESVQASATSALGTHTLRGTYTYNSATGVLTFNTTSSDICGHTNLSSETDTGVVITATTLTYAVPNKGTDTWTRPSGTAGNLLGAWPTTDSATGLTYTLTFNADNTYSITVVEGACSVPTAPASVTATAGDGQAAINWSAVSGATSYNLYWSTTSGVTKTSGTKITGVTSPFTHIGRTNGTAYYYVVAAVNGNGESVASAQTSATPATSPLAQLMAGSWWEQNNNDGLRQDGTTDDFAIETNGPATITVANGAWTLTGPDTTTSPAPHTYSITFPATAVTESGNTVTLMDADGLGRTLLTYVAASNSINGQWQLKYNGNWLANYETWTETTQATGYVSQGGLTWSPETSAQYTYAGAASYCSSATFSGLSGWRLPTLLELSGLATPPTVLTTAPGGLYASGAMNGQGWALSYVWSSTPVTSAGTPGTFNENYPGYWGIFLSASTDPAYPYASGAVVNSAPQDSGYVTCVRSSGATPPAQTFTGFAVPSGGVPFGIATGPDGNLWFSDMKTNSIGKMTPTGVVTSYTIPTTTANNTADCGYGSCPQTIVSGPNGNMWFVEGNGNKIAKITTAGVITEYANTAGGWPQDLAVGPDGNIWFTDQGITGTGAPPPGPNGAIGKLDIATGIITKYPLLTANTQANFITLGPDGAMWFTQSNGIDTAPASGSNLVARITMAGVITEFPNTGGAFITTGSDGNLWLTAPGTGIGKLTTAGVQTMFAIPSATLNPFSITAGPDGNLWFSEVGGMWPSWAGGGNLGRITTSGVVTEFALPASSEINTAHPTMGVVTVGPDGAIWFADPRSARIVRFQP